MNAVETGSWLSRERVTRIAAISGLGGIAMLLFLWLARSGTVDHFGQPVGSDFTAFWNAGRIAWTADPAQAWNQQLLNASVTATHGTPYGTAWLYPPVFLLVAALLAALPYLPALLVWQVCSLAVVAATLKRILARNHDLLIALASPLTPMVLAHGQNAFLTAGLLGSGLIQLERRPWVAGACFGALIYKPQLALVIVPLLLLTRSWRALAATALVASVLVAVSALLFGIQSWTAFAQTLSVGRTYMEQGSVGFYKSASLFSIARLWGGSVCAGYVLQLVGMLAALLVIWRAADSSANVRSAAVCAAAALSTPYLLDYDMAVVGLGAAFLYAEAREGAFLPYERSALAFVWAAAWFSRPAAQYLLLPLGPIAMVLVACFAWRKARQGIAIPPLMCSVCPVT